MLSLKDDMELMVDEYASEIFSKYQSDIYSLKICSDCFDRKKIQELSLMIYAKREGNVPLTVAPIAKKGLILRNYEVQKPPSVANKETIIRQTVVEKVNIIKEITPAPDPTWESTEW